MTRRRFSRQPVVFRNQSEHRSAPRNGNCSNLQIIKEVQDLFDGIFEDELVLDVLEDCNYDKQRATEALFEMGPQARLREQNSVRPAPRQEAAGPCWWDELPQECKLQVWEHLSARDLAKAAGSCREFADFAKEARSSTRTLKLPAGLSAAAVEGMVKAFSNADRVRVHPTQTQMLALAAAIAAGADARLGGVPVDSLDCTNCRAMVDAVMLQLFHSIGTLRYLDLTNCTGITDHTLTRLASIIRIFGGSNSGAEEADEGDALGMDALQLEDGAAEAGRPWSTTRAFVEGGFAVTKQHHSPVGAPGVSSSGRSAARRLIHSLRALSVAGCPEVSSVGVLDLMQAASKTLISLNVSRSAVSSLQLRRWGVLQTLTANQCSSLTSVTMQLPKSAPLRELSLSGCTNLAKVVLTSSTLRSLNVSGNSSLSHLQLACEALESLSASQCGRLEALHESFACPALLQANFAGCKSLSGLSESLAGSTQLVMLNISGCISLFGLLLPNHEHLTCLTASGCKQMRTINCASPALETCLTQSCLRLEALRLQAQHLRRLDISGCSALRELRVSGLEALTTQSPSTASSSKDPLILNIEGCPLLRPEMVERLQAAFSRRKSRR